LNQNAPLIWIFTKDVLTNEYLLGWQPSMGCLFETLA
jgi:hypothetical protein